MNKPMTASRREELVDLVEDEEWSALLGQWGSGEVPFGLLGEAVMGVVCGCPSQVRYSNLRSDLTDKDHAALLEDPLIVDINTILLLDDSRCPKTRKALADDPGAIFDRFEHYQRLVQ